MTDEEYWLPVVGYEGLYEVSDMGRVRSLDRVDCAGRKRKSKLLSIGCRYSRYPQVLLSKNGVREHFRTHNLVLQAFKSDRPKGSWAFHHNGDPLDVRATNLSWDTPANVCHATSERGVKH